MRKCYHIIYKGTVQGVGFRYTVQRIASSVMLCGWVKNLPDGSVEAIVEGEKEDITAFKDNLQVRMGGYIRDTQINEIPCNGDYTSFEIRVG